MIIRSLRGTQTAISSSIQTNLLVLFLICASPMWASAQEDTGDTWITDFDNAMEIAGQTRRDLIIDFAGDEESRPSQLLYQQVLSQPSFQVATDDRFVRVVVCKEAVNRLQGAESDNETRFDELIEQYQIRGFPTIILADSKGRPYAKMMGYHGESPAEVLEQIQTSIDFRNRRDRHLQKAITTQGIERAQELDLAIRTLQENWRVRHYRSEIEQIISSDARNLGGLRVPYELELIRFDAKYDNLREQARQLDNMAENFNLPPNLLQEVYYTKAALLYEVDRERAIRAFETARTIDPNSHLGMKIDNILKTAFPSTPQQR